MGKKIFSLQVISKILQQIPCPEDFSVYRDVTESETFLKHKGGERNALEQLKKRLRVEEEAFANGTYLPNQANVDLLGEPTSMSAELRFGCLSVRHFFYAIHDKFVEAQVNSKFPMFAGGHHITCQLLWREYFYTMSVMNPNYDRVEGNPICLNIPWSVPKDDDVTRWKQGRTGIPIVDAAMRQLMVKENLNSSR